MSNSSGIETDGRTYVKNVPSKSIDMANNKINILFSIVINGTHHNQSRLTTVEQCTIPDTTTTGA